MYKVLHGLCYANILTHFSYNISVHLARQHKKLCLPFTRTRKIQMCITYIGINIWNSIKIKYEFVGFKKN